MATLTGERGRPNGCPDYYAHRSVGVLEFESGNTWWARLKVDSGITGYYSWLARTYGLPVMTFAGRFAHVTVVRGEEPAEKSKWGSWHGREVEFYYSHACRWTEFHLWVDVWCEELTRIRAELGYPPKLQKRLSDGRVSEHSFHLTIGKRV